MFIQLKRHGSQKAEELSFYIKKKIQDIHDAILKLNKLNKLNKLDKLSKLKGIFRKHMICRHND